MFKKIEKNEYDAPEKSSLNPKGIVTKIIVPSFGAILSNKGEVKSMFRTLRNPKLLKIYLIPLFSVLLGTMTQSIAVLYVFELGGSISEVNLISTIRSAMGILLIVPFGILSDRFGRKPMVLYPRLIQFVGVIIYAFATHPNHLLIASLVGGFAGGAFFPVLLSLH